MPVSLAYSKAGFATLNSLYAGYQASTVLPEVGMISTADAETVIDTAFAGMMFDLAGKAWLAVDVEDMGGAPVGGVGVGRVSTHCVFHEIVQTVQICVRCSERLDIS